MPDRVDGEFETGVTPQPLALGSFDPSGQVFLHSGRILRGVFKGEGERVRRVLGIIESADLFRLGIVRTSVVTDAELPGGPYDLVLEHERVPFVSYAHEWTASMLQDAALLMLRLFVDLGEHGLTLKDMHPHNIVFDSTRPVFVDFTSIIPLEELQAEEYLKVMRPDTRGIDRFRDVQGKTVNQMYELMFAPYFMFPLEMMAQRRYAESRRRVFDTTLHTSFDVISAREAMGKWTVPRLSYEFRRLVRGVSLIGGGHRKAAFFGRLIADVGSLSVSPPSSDYASYYDEKGEQFGFDPSDAWSTKQRSVNAVLERLRPKSVLDLAGNTGWFATLAVKRGARAVAFDIDEACADGLYRKSRSAGLPVLSLVIDSTDPTPDVAAVEYANESRRAVCDVPVMSAASRRLKCEMVMALAIIHHLALGQDQSLRQIVDTLDSFTEKHLLVEYVDPQDPLVVAEPEFFPAMKRNPSGFDWYTLENFICALGERFGTVERLPSHPDSRTLLLCSRY